MIDVTLVKTVLTSSLDATLWHETTLTCLPHGYLLPRDSDPEILQRYQRYPSRRQRLKTLALRWKLSRPQFIELPWPASIEPMHAARVYNDNLIVWTERWAYKFPLTSTAITRMQRSKEAREVLANSPLKKFLFPAEVFTHGDRLYRRGRMGDLVPLPPSGVTTTDGFISTYINAAHSTAQRNAQGVLIGFQHGDLHINNVLIHPESGLGLIDFDEFESNGIPAVDLLSFAVHFAGFYIERDYAQALHQALQEPAKLHRIVEDHGLKACAELLREYHTAAILPAFIRNRRHWLDTNAPEPDFAQHIKRVLSQYD